MTHLHNLPLQDLRFYATAPYVCSYLSHKKARSQVVTPGYIIDRKLYSALVDQGFRRSGAFVYRPHCDHCHACVPVRVNVRHFSPNRSQKRAWARHAHMESRECDLVFREEHYRLYARYQQCRHLEGPVLQEGEEQYRHFLLQSSVTTRLVEFREEGQLRMVSVIDELDQGLSSVYTFYDPDLPGASLGTYSVLWQIREAAQRGLPWVYLGYWIAESRKMAYKIRFQPLERLKVGHWIPLRPEN